MCDEQGLTAVNILYRPKDKDIVKNSILREIKNAGLELADIDVVMSGNTDASLEQNLIPDAQVVAYKKLCGEYPTSTAFAMAVGAKVIHGDANTKIALGINNANPENILIYNQHQNINHSIIILSKV